MGLMMWIFQRLTALSMALYALFVYIHFSAYALSFLSLRALFESPVLALWFALTVLAIAIHAWIGVWTMVTDYLHSPCMRYPVLIGYGLLLVTAFLDTLLFLSRI